MNTLSKQAKKCKSFSLGFFLFKYFLSVILKKRRAKNMRKSDYLETINKKTGVSKKDIDSVVDLFLDLIVKEITDTGKSSITNIGTFKRIKTKSFTYFSPNDGSTINTKGITKISFTSSKDLLKKITK